MPTTTTTPATASDFVGFAPDLPANLRRSTRERIRLGRTLYEITITRGDSVALLAYAGRKSRAGLIAACRSRGADVVAFCGAGEFELGRRAADGITCGGWRIAFSGRTQLEALEMGRRHSLPTATAEQAAAAQAAADARVAAEQAAAAAA